MEPGAETKLFGEKVVAKFRPAAADMAASGRCLAKDEWTACVFHSMRVLELGLYAFARRLRIASPKPLTSQSWGTIIDQIESAIRTEQKKQPPKGRAAKAKRSEKLKQWSQAASHFRYLKDAYRNHVSHARVPPYDEDEAFSVWGHTRDFMQALVEFL